MISRRMLRIKVIKTLYAHLKSESDSLMASQKTLVNSIDKTYDLYVLTLSLVAELAHYAEQRQELAKKKQLPTWMSILQHNSKRRRTFCSPPFIVKVYFVIILHIKLLSSVGFSTPSPSINLACAYNTFV